MKKYKTVIIDMKRIRGAGAMAAFAAVAAVTAAYIGIPARTSDSAERILESSIPAIAAAQGKMGEKAAMTAAVGLPLAGQGDAAADGGGAAAGAAENAEEMPNENTTGGNSDSASGRGGMGSLIAAAARRTLAFFLSFDITDSRTVIAGELPLLRTVSRGPLAVMANGETVAAYNPRGADTGGGSAEPDTPAGGLYPIKTIDSSQGKALGKGKILIRNETDYGIDINEMLSSKLKLDMKGAGPKVLILHTHATEAYSAEGATEYLSDKSDRSLSEEENVIRIGNVIEEELKKAGIEALHDKTLHDYPNFNGSYANSLKTIEKYKVQYPSIQAVFDVHRDAFVADDGSKAKFVTDAGGAKAAQLMLVVGTDAGGLEHNNWRENMKLALQLQQFISEKYPTLMRGVNLRRERFNGHTTLGSLIIEVGASGNSMSEAENGARCAAQRIGEYLAALGK